MSDVYEHIEKIPGVAVRKDELLSLHTTLGVGGPCDLMVWVSEADALVTVIDIAKKEGLPFMMLGSGSNVLVRDGGVEGIVLRLSGDFTKIEIDSPRIGAGAAAHLAEVVSAATQAGAPSAGRCNRGSAHASTRSGARRATAKFPPETGS